jgi:NhaA family Na+:H+ antiporter
VNDIFMAFFFGVAMVHVTKALRPGGSLSPLKRALAPLFGTVGGVLGPAVLYLSLVAIQGNFATESSGWAVCIATDISVAWLVATVVFGSGTHPAVEFLLLLAVADDVIGLIVIAVAFPTGEMHPMWLLMVLAAIAICALFRWALKLEQWFFYVFIAGPISWYGLYMAGVHPALALCVVVPFIPGDNIEKFDHNCSLIVHVGLFFFALCNAGVAFKEIGMVTLNITISLVFGKTVGIFLFTWLGVALAGLQLPDGMKKRHLALLAHVSGAGLTVALFVAELAFKDPIMRDQARLGALLTVIVGPSAICLESLFPIKEKVMTMSKGKTRVADSV